MLSSQEIKSLLLTCLLFGLTSGSKLECCKPGIDWVDNSSVCKDNNSVSLICKSYAVDPYNDKAGFYFVNESNWLITVDDGKNIVEINAPGKFCRAKLNNEVRYLICFSEDSILSKAENTQKWHATLFGLCCTLSGIFLAFTLLVYVILPELRDLQDKAIMSLCACFMVAFFINGTLKLGNLASLLDDTSCTVVGFIMYYSFFSAFFWLNVIALNIWRSVWFPQLKLTNNTLLVIYCALGWGVPLCFLALAAIAQYVDGAHVKPGLGDGSCWFNGYYATWLYFYGPILMLLSLNLVYIGLTGWKLWHKYEAFDCSRVNVLKTKCTMCVKLFIVMGANWIFEVVSFAFRDTNQFIWLLPDLLNSSQGLIIFVFFVVSRTKVRKLLAERRPCKIPFPESWTAYKDHEKSEENYIDEFRLSHAS